MRPAGPVIRLWRGVGEIARAYSALFFLDSPPAGGLLLAATFVYPNVGGAGLAAALVGSWVAGLFDFPRAQRCTCVLNALLVGLSLGAFYQLNWQLASLIAAGAALAVFTSAALADLFWRQERLPVLVIPFLLVAGVAALAARQIDGLTPMPAYGGSYSTPWLPAWADSFLGMLGATFFTVHPLAGAVVLIVMAWRSRYLALLSVAALLVGQLGFILLRVDPPPLLLVWAGFNLVLTSIAIGGIYTVPGIAGFLTAMLAALLTTLLLLACQDLLLVYRLPVIALPYIVITLIFLLALRTRVSIAPPWLAAQPGMPEQNYERARLARVRNGEVNSVPLLLPVFGRWQIYQGFNGEHTHRPPWQHALDFHVTQDGSSFSGKGEHLDEFYCFGLPVLCPVNGKVVRVRDHLPDNAPGEVDTKNNWGNFVLIQLDSGLHVLLAHLKQHSVRVKESEWVTPGKLLGACGSSGRSPQPHLHLQVQRAAHLGSPTEPFHLCSLLHHHDDGTSEYLVNARPRVGDILEAALVDPRLATPMHLPVGRQLTYLLEGDGVPPDTRHRLQVELTLLGQFRLVSDTGASAAFEEKNGVLAFYDRQGPKDALLDAWLLACGLTPLSENAHLWSDSPSAQLLPLPYPGRLLMKVLHPLGCGIASHYQRELIGEDGAWQQSGRHELRLGGSWLYAQTQCVIEPELGCRIIILEFGARRWRAQLTELGLAADEGVPG